MTVTCSKCKIPKPISAFRFRPEGRKHLRSHCNDCSKEDGRVWGMKNRKKRSDYSREWRANNRARHNWSHRSYAHGHRFSWDELVALYEKQGHKCAICKMERPLTGHNGLSIDHNHKTNQYRALLCSGCNRMLGLAKENVDILVAAIQYLADWES